VVIDCESAHGFGQLAGLPLQQLVVGRVSDVDGLRRLESLRLLSLTHTLTGTRLTDSLPAAPLEFLFLGRGTTEETGLRGLSHWVRLKVLSLSPTAPLTADDWAEIAWLPLLTRLQLNARLFPDGLGPMPVLPGITELRLAELRGGEDLSALPPRLPGVRVVDVRGVPGSRPDAAAFRALFPGAEVTVGDH
jgi:hypothetical protein